MAKTYNQKAKILYLERMLWQTGEEQTISMQEILEKLEGYGIRAERKSIYDDMEALRSFGMDIKYRRGSQGGYYLASRDDEDNWQQEMLEKYKSNKPEAEFPAMELSTNSEESHTQKMKLLFHNDVREEVERVLGKDWAYKEKGANSFSVTIRHKEDAQLYGWLASMGKNVHIQKPVKAALAYRNYLKGIAKEYKGIDK